MIKSNPLRLTADSGVVLNLFACNFLVTQFKDDSSLFIFIDYSIEENLKKIMNELNSTG